MSFSGNASQGIYIGDAGTTNNVVAGNTVGLNAAYDFPGVGVD